MKKTLKTISGFAMVTLLLMGACQEKPKESKDEQPEEPREVKAPKQIISLEKADSLFTNYGKRRLGCIVDFESENQPEGEAFQPTRSSMVSIDVLKEYIRYVEHKGKEGGAKVDSIRIYFGNYGENVGKKNRRNTLFLLPTAQTNKGYGGIYLDEKGNASLIREFFSNREQKSKASFLPNLLNFTVQGRTSLILNELGDTPPPPEDF